MILIPPPRPVRLNRPRRRDDGAFFSGVCVGIAAASVMFAVAQALS